MFPASRQLLGRRDFATLRGPLQPLHDAHGRPGRQRGRGGDVPGLRREITRFRTTRQLVGYLGLDPRVRQSGTTPAAHGRISKQGAGPARQALVEAAWSVVRQPGLWAANTAMRRAERELARQAELAYQRAAAGWHANEGRERDTGTRISRPSKRQAARQGISPKPCALARRRPRPRKLSQEAAHKSTPTLTSSVAPSGSHDYEAARRYSARHG